VANGTAAAPSLAFASDVNTGLYRVGAEVIGFTTNGTAKATIDDTAAPIKEIFSSVYYPIATQVDVGTDPNQIPLNGYLGTMAFQDEVSRFQAASTAPTNNLDINFEYVSNTSIKIRMRGSDGTVRAVTLTLV
jgi:hypothetical protein